MRSLTTTGFRLVLALAIAHAGAMTAVHQASAHAEFVSSDPPAGGTVTDLPASMTIKFSEEVKPGSAVVEVTGPDGARVDDGSAAVDLTNAQRNTVTVGLFAGGPGAYSVHWENDSNLDGDHSTGDYSFTVAATPAASATSGPTTPQPTSTEGGANGNPLSKDGDFDSRAFVVSLGAGALALLAIVGAWLLLRPKHPRFGPRAERDER
jgi:methionine-rich copper-binding protein CopC